MKTISYLSLFLTFSIEGFGQGLVDFNNHRPNVDVPVFDDRGVRLSGTNYLAQLYAGKTRDRLVGVDMPVPFLTNGYWGVTYRGLVVTIPYEIAGISGPVWVQARVWEVAGGPTFEQAALAGRWTGISTVLFLPATGRGGEIPPVPLIGLADPASSDYIPIHYPGNPIIVREPEKQKLRAGETATLSVVASGGVAMSYQWYQGQSGDTNNPSLAATNASFTTPPLSTNSSFWVKVTTSAGSTNGAAAAVTVVPANAARLNLRLDGGQPSLSIDGPVGTAYRIDMSQDLSPNGWQALTNLTLQINPLTFTDTTAANFPARFYRVVVP